MSDVAPSRVPPAPSTGEPASPMSRFGVPALAALLVLVLVTGVLDDRARQHTGAVFTRALIAFAAARGLDAAISLAQGTEIALQPAGMGLTISAGEILDPVNDLVEQFSWIMLVSTTSLGVQQVLLRMSSWWFLTALAVLVVVARAAVSLRPELASPRTRDLLHRAFVALLILRLAVPLYAVAGGLIFDVFLEPGQAEAVGQLEAATGDIRDLDRLDEQPQDLAAAGWLSRMSTWFRTTVESLDVEERIEAFRTRLAETTEYVIQLTVVFVFQTVLLPLAFLWLLPRVAGAILPRT